MSPITTTTQAGKITLSRTVNVPRTCSGCGHSWQGSITLEASQTTEASVGGPDNKELDEARRTAESTLDFSEREIQKKGEPNRDVLCPQCGHFDSGAMERHFPKGFQDGLQRRLRGSITGGFVGSALVGAGLFLVGRSFLRHLLGGPEGTGAFRAVRDFLGGWNTAAASLAVFIMGPAIIIGLCVLLLNLLGELKETISNRGPITERLRETTEEELLAIVRECYRKHDEDLRHIGGWMDLLLEPEASGSGEAVV